MIGGRRYTSYAQWKFREFNELPHLFVRRLHESYTLANTYIGQFPNENMTLLMRFVAFVSGSFAAVLFLATILDPDILANLEITPHRTVLFYFGVFGTVMTVARGMIPEEGHVFDPEMLMTHVISYTHYMPEEWKDQLHSKRVGFGRFGRMCSHLCAGPPGIWGALCHESADLHRRTSLSCSYSFCPVVLIAAMRSCDSRFFQRVHGSRRWKGLCV